MQTYGLLLADNGSDWYVSGDSDDRWDAIMDDVITGLRAVHGSDFDPRYGSVDSRVSFC